MKRFFVVLTAPFIYLCAIPIFFLDAYISLYQAICFPAFGIPYVRRRDCFLFDRVRLPYLNLRDRLHCAYCSYANGVCVYATEIIARTEQRWCPIKHAHPIEHPHSRYGYFFEYGDAATYRRHADALCRDFNDLMMPPRRPTAFAPPHPRSARIPQTTG
jgi:hypothetical protein